ncbi:hypothetical protein [Latilactobacillus curvatus]
MSEEYRTINLTCLPNNEAGISVKIPNPLLLDPEIVGYALPTSGRCRLAIGHRAISLFVFASKAKT